MGTNFTLPICDKRIRRVLQEPGLYAPRAAPGSALRSTDLHGKMAPKKALSGTRDRDAQESCRNGSKALTRILVLTFEQGLQLLLQVAGPAILLGCLERIHRRASNA